MLLRDLEKKAILAKSEAEAINGDLDLETMPPMCILGGNPNSGTTEVED